MSSIPKVRAYIRQRNETVGRMIKDYDPLERIAAFKAEADNKITTEYKKALQGMQDRTKADMASLEAQYKRQEDSPTKQVERLTLASNDYRSMSTRFLEEHVDKMLALPPGIRVDPIDAKCLAVELRNRKRDNKADLVSSYILNAKLETPWENDERYQALAKRLNRISVLDAQSGTMFVLSENPDIIEQSDVVMVESLDTAQV